MGEAAEGVEGVGAQSATEQEGRLAHVVLQHVPVERAPRAAMRSRGGVEEEEAAAGRGIARRVVAHRFGGGGEGLDDAQPPVGQAATHIGRLVAVQLHEMQAVAMGCGRDLLLGDVDKDAHATHTIRQRHVRHGCHAARRCGVEDEAHQIDAWQRRHRAHVIRSTQSADLDQSAADHAVASVPCASTSRRKWARASPGRLARMNVSPMRKPR